ncbi:MAG: alginate export family protein [Paracoccaceae bacterium]
MNARLAPFLRNPTMPEARRAFVAAMVAMVLLMAGPAQSQTYATDPYQDRPVGAVTVTIANPSGDAAFNDRITDAVRSGLAVFPGSRFSEDRVTFAIGAARRNPAISAVEYELLPGTAGDVDVAVRVTLADAGKPAAGKGYVLTGERAELPLLYDRNGTVLRFKFDVLNMYYGNNNAWYGRPDLLLAGNPLAQGETSGKGWDNWVESYAHYGLYGITPISQNFYVYGGISGITSLSYGQELFTDQSRSHTAVEDAYVGFITGNTDARGNRLAFNFTAGRKQFNLASAFLIANTAANGGERAALQANARWAADLLVLGQLSWNNTKFEAFFVDPDELPVLDSKTTIAGINIESIVRPGLMLGASYLTVPESNSNYFSPVGGIAGSREGLNVVDLRFTYNPPGGQEGFFLGGEIARQTNRNFDMDARAAYGEVGYTFAKVKWSPSISYRLSYFSGDDPDTSTYERWDPLLSGGNGEQWVQGANHFKIVQDSNVIAHRIQARFRVAPRVEIVPQLWAFYADQTNNIGGNPALTFMTDREYGYEANVTVKWFVSRNVYVHGHVAYTVPGKSVRDALDGTEKDWLSAMVFVRYAF